MGAIVEVDELRRSEGGSQSVEAWEDGTGLELKQEFESSETVKDIVRRASSENCFGMVLLNSDTKRFVVKCAEFAKGCSWYLRVAKGIHSSCFKVTKYNKMHTCSRVSSSSDLRTRGTQRLVASIVKDLYPGKFDTPKPKELIEQVQREAAVTVSYSTAWRGKNRAINELRGSPQDSFHYLPSYLEMLEEANPGTVYRLEMDEQQRFKYLFVALGPCIEGFAGMRKVIIVDATFLKAGYNGCLVFATAQDPNHHHYPIAFGVIDGENHLSWDWFFESLKTVIPDSDELVFVSDRHQSLINAVKVVYPRSVHGFCIFHMSQNVKSHSGKKDEVAEKFMECARQYTEADFLKKMAEFKANYPSAARYLESGKKDKEQETINSERKWARCYFPGERYNIDTSNSVESMNAVFKDARKYAILPMIDVIIAKFTEWFNRHRKESASGSCTEKLVPYVENILHKSLLVTAKLSVVELNSFQLEYKVTGKNGTNYVVDLLRKTCECKRFDIDKYACVHALAAARKYMKQPKEERHKGDIHYHDLCSRYYWTEQWVLAYSRTIYPVAHMSQWLISAETLNIVASLRTLATKREEREKRGIHQLENIANEVSGFWDGPPWRIGLIVVGIQIQTQRCNLCELQFQ